ncbi:MAG: amino acid ABC transporter permease [Lachnospiraceae bacterium]|nr:amino acid ABC transporter permease [Lachnospiraceae bacterium]
MSISWTYVWKIFQVSIPYLGQTIWIAICAFLIAMLLALVLSIVNENRIPVLYQIGKVYTSFFRSTPLIAQLFFFYYGFAQISETIRTMKPTTALILIIGLNQASFMAETLRGAFFSVDQKQREAALACGLTRWQMLYRIVIPQAIRVAVPALSNSFVGIMKTTSLGFTIGAMEFLGRAKMEATNLVRFFEGYLVILVVYWIMIALLSAVQKKMENKLNNLY